MKYRIFYSNKFSKNFKKISVETKEQINEVINRLANNQTLEPKYKDHKLKGEYKEFRECHIKPDLLLIYQKQENILVLTCINIGSHSELF